MALQVCFTQLSSSFSGHVHLFSVTSGYVFRPEVLINVFTEPLNILVCAIISHVVICLSGYRPWHCDMCIRDSNTLQTSSGIV